MEFRSAVSHILHTWVAILNSCW